MVTRGLLSLLVLLCVLVADGLARYAGENIVPEFDREKNSVRPTGEAGERGELQVAGQQAGATDDLTITQKIRRAILEDDSLSIYAQNVKIITHQGVVTLRGAVRSSAEKDSVEQKARAVVGGANVRSEIQIVAANSMRY